MRRLRGLVVRCGLMVLPLIMVISLCCLMFGLRGKTSLPVAAAMTQPHLVVQSAFIPPAEAAIPRANTSTNRPLAAFERLHVFHARLNVPTD